MSEEILGALTWIRFFIQIKFSLNLSPSLMIIDSQNNHKFINLRTAKMNLILSRYCIRPSIETYMQSSAARHSLPIGPHKISIGFKGACNCTSVTCYNP
jgi:hypothetical protein